MPTYPPTCSVASPWITSSPRRYDPFARASWDFAGVSDKLIVMILDPVVTDERPFDFFSQLLAYGNEYATLRDFTEYDEPLGDEHSIPIDYEPL